LEKKKTLFVCTQKKRKKLKHIEFLKIGFTTVHLCILKFEFRFVEFDFFFFFFFFFPHTTKRRKMLVALSIAAAVATVSAKSALTVTDQGVRVDFYPAWSREEHDCFASSCPTERVYNIFLNKPTPTGEPLCDFVRPLSLGMIFCENWRPCLYFFIFSSHHKKKKKKKMLCVSFCVSPIQVSPPKLGAMLVAKTSNWRSNRMWALCSARCARRKRHRVPWTLCVSTAPRPPSTCR
jgi:hypothetical protein